MSNIFEEYASNVNYFRMPGEPENKTAIFVGTTAYTEEKPEGVSIHEIEEYVNHNVAPWVLMRGIQCAGIDHGNFIRERDYCSVMCVPYKKEEDYYLNTSVLNYAMAVMVAAEEHSLGSKGITLVQYVGEADYCSVFLFANESEFREYADECLKTIREEKEEEE
jgi:hypothetical protein